jgi:predicted Fe-S protein YdhL (DUF1289 family)
MNDARSPAPADDGDVQSPCTNICVMDPQTGYCRGCSRTIEEIADWSTATRDRKLAIIAELPARKASVAA